LRFSSSTAADPNFTVLHITGLSFTYDPSGRRLTHSDTWGRQVHSYDGVGQLTQTVWGYDIADRPISRSGPMGETATYDVRGKRIAVAGLPDLATGATDECVPDGGPSVHWAWVNSAGGGNGAWAIAPTGHTCLTRLGRSA